MKIAIMSDLHGSLSALELVLDQLSTWQPDHYLLLGDVLNHGPRNPVPPGYAPAAVAERLNQLAPQIMAVRGNCDSEVDQMLLDFPMMAPYNQLLVDGRRWFVSHGHLYRPEAVPLPAGSLFISGHTHMPVLQREGELVLMNPGSICFPRAELAATYGRYEDGVLGIHACADSEALLRLNL
ncbi:phosphodiesterase [Aeromonas popoffii]|uniref:phosphodiesterase n=1 Tax=Aeromonas popoffii TaxID=70856 RepID=UPI0030D07DE1